MNLKQNMIISQLTTARAKLEMDDPASALCGAAGAGDLAQVKRLIENGVDPNKGDYDLRCVGGRSGICRFCMRCQMPRT